MNTKRPFTFKKKREDGFTFVELLIVIVTLVVLIVALLPAFASTHPNSQAFQCLENLRQLTLAWQMYAEDNNGKLSPDGDQVTQDTTPTGIDIQPGGRWYQWCPGNVNTYNPYATNFLQASCLYLYLKTITVYHCPADQSGVRFGPNFYPHIRSYSMNCFMAPIQTWPSVGTKNFFKETDINNPRPSMAYVFIGENENSINDSFFVHDPTQDNYWQDFPATRHGDAGSLSYADGHSEMKRWTDKVLLHPPHPPQTAGGDPTSGDSAWLSERATSLIQ